MGISNSDSGKLLEDVTYDIYWMQLLVYYLRREPESCNFLSSISTLILTAVSTPANIAGVLDITT